MAWQNVRLSVLASENPTNKLAVYRVHWLKAKSQRDRWSEERKLLRHEMDFTVNFMANTADDWEVRASQAGADRGNGHGLCCYAFRQANMWRRMATQARQEFDEVLQADTC